jgi:AraC-like DNA-binding protein
LAGVHGDVGGGYPEDEATLAKVPLAWMLREAKGLGLLVSGRSLGQMVAAACPSAYHFARPFEAATGLPPNQYVLARHVERAQQLLQRNRDRFLAEVAARAGFSDQSRFCQHVKRVVGVTPGQFQTPARIA